MKHSVTVLRYLTTDIVVFVLCFLVSFTISSAVLAPTTEVSILGASQSENEALQNFTNYQVEAPPDKNTIQATSYKVINLTSGSILTKSHADIPLPIASLTKLMTAWVTMHYGNLNDEYTITAHDIEATSPSLNLKVGDTVAVKDLMLAMLIGSTNDAALSLSGYIEQKTGNDFASLMNKEAKSLNMSSSRYSNPMGFDSNTNYSSADDIELLVKKLLATNIFEQTSKETSYQFQAKNGSILKTTATNKLIGKYEDLYAIKTGFTNTALGSMVTIIKHNNDSYLIIVIGSPNREADTLELRNLVNSR